MNYSFQESMISLAWSTCTRVKVLFRGTQIMLLMPVDCFYGNWEVKALEGAERYFYKHNNGD